MYVICKDFGDTAPSRGKQSQWRDRLDLLLVSKDTFLSFLTSEQLQAFPECLCVFIYFCVFFSSESIGRQEETLGQNF